MLLLIHHANMLLATICYYMNYMKHCRLYYNGNSKLDSIFKWQGFGENTVVFCHSMLPTQSLSDMAIFMIRIRIWQSLHLIHKIHLSPAWGNKGVNHTRFVLLWLNIHWTHGMFLHFFKVYEIFCFHFDWQAIVTFIIVLQRSTFFFPPQT